MLYVGESQVIEEKDISEKVASLQAELHRAFGVKARSLAKALRKTGRRRPAHLGRKADTILQAQSYGGHPRLMRMVDTDEFARAHADIMDYLKEFDAKKRRRNLTLDMLAGMVLKLLIVVVLVIGVLVWQEII